MRIGLIGGGPSNIAVFVELSRRLAGLVSEVFVFDHAGILTSPAFNADSDLVLANTSVGVTSIVSNNDVDFLNWLRDTESSISAQLGSFVPRRLIREYAWSRFQSARDQLASYSCNTNVILQEVVDIRGLSEGRLLISTREQTIGPLDAVVLGTGAPFKQPPDLLRKVAGRALNPYPISKLLQETDDDDEILIVGTKLTAIDTAISLLEHKRSARITLVSPSGQLPAVRSQLLLHRPNNFVAREIITSGARSLLRQAERAAALDLKQLASEKPVQRNPTSNVYLQLYQDIFDCERGRNAWQDAMASFIEEANELWPHFSPQQQLRFKKRHARFISRYVSSFPLQSAKKLASGIQSGRISIQKMPPNPSFDLGRNGTILFQDRVFDRLVNATGIDPTAFQTTALYSALSSRGDVFNIHGGLNVDPTTMQITSLPFESKVYAIGALVNGSLLVTNYLRSSVKQAERIVHDLSSAQQVDYPKTQFIRTGGNA